MTELGFTGTRHGMTPHQMVLVHSLLEKVDPRHSRAHHGDCVGSDAQFHSMCLELGIPVVIHPPEDAKLRAFCEFPRVILPPKPYLDRNRDIVRQCEFLIATPAEASEPVNPRGKGVWFTIRFARNLGRHHLTIPPHPPRK